MISLSVRGGLLLATAISLAGCVGKEDHDAVKAQLSAAYSSVVTLESDLQAANDEVAAGKTKITELEGLIAGLNSEVAELKADLASSNIEHTSLSDENSRLTDLLETESAKVISLTADLETLKADISSLEGENARLIEVIAGKDVDLEKAVADAAVLQKKIDDQKKEISKLEADLTSVGGELQATRDLLVAANGTIATLTDDLAKVNVKYANYLKTAYNAAQDRAAYKRTMGVDAKAVAAAAAALAKAKDALSKAIAAAPNPTFLGVTLATYLAQDRDSAVQYAKAMGLDINSNVDQNVLVSDVDYQNRLNVLSLQVGSKEVDLANSENSYNSNFGGHSNGNQVTLYSADGEAIGANGAAIYRNMPDGTTSGDDVPVVAKLTALFLLDANGQPSQVLVWEGTGIEFTDAPVGTAMFTSDSMVAYFAHQEGNGVYSLSSDQSSSAGQLSLNFDTKSGTLLVNGMPNGQNLDYAISASLVFDTATGEFTGEGKQAYSTNNGMGPAETAEALIEGNLWGAAEAFTATINADDTTDQSIEVHIMTVLGGTGSLSN
jgi:hypothetical protein